MANQYHDLRACLWRVGIVFPSIFAAAVTYGGESCGAWLVTTSDPGDGKYLMTLQLRSCDLTGGVSAFLQFKNSGNENIKLSYRVYGEEEKILKEGSLALLPGETRRDATCQQCAKRKGGIKSWAIVSVEVLSPGISPGLEQEVANTVDTNAKPPEKIFEITKPVVLERDISAPKAESNEIRWDELPPEFRQKK